MIEILKWIAGIYAIGWVALAVFAFQSPNYGDQRLTVLQRIAVGAFWPYGVWTVLLELFRTMR